MIKKNNHSWWRRLIVTLIVLTVLNGTAPRPAARAQDQDAVYKEALDRILAAKDTGATELDLRGLGLAELPPEIGQLTNLQTLDLGDNVYGGNVLTNLPPEIGQLTNLQTLDLSGNHLSSLPPEIGQLTHLRELDLSGNALISLPPEIGQLTNLQVLV